MKAVIKLSEYQDNYGWHSEIHFFGIFKDEEEVEQAIRADVKEITEDWDEEEVPKVSLKTFKRDGNTIGGFRFSDYEEEEGDTPDDMWLYADNVWTYIVENVK